MPPNQHLEGRLVARNGETLQEFGVAGPAGSFEVGDPVQTLQDRAQCFVGHVAHSGETPHLPL